MSGNQRGPENGDAGTSCLFAIDASAIKIGKEIGKGAFSVVYAGEYNKKHVAVKCQPKDEEGKIPPFVLKEVEILQKLRHSNILEFIGAADSRKTRQILILSEHSNNGDLDQLLKNIRKDTAKHVGWARMAQMALDIASGIAFMHSQQFIHRDIKSSNILLDDHFRAKLCDFGFATDTQKWQSGKNDGEPARRKSYCGTDAFMAPEMFLDEDYNENVDVFSFGVVLMEMLCCRQANQDGFLMRLPQYKFQVRSEEFRAALPASCPAVLARLAEQCVAFEPAERPTAVQVVNALQEMVSHKGIDTSDAVELRPYTPTEREMADCEPQMEEDDDDDDEDGDDDEDELGSEDCDDEAEECTEEPSVVDVAPTLPPPYTSGIMLKRNRRGNRGWSEKQFILDRDQLHYTDLPAKNQKENKGRRLSLSAPQPTMSSLPLKECRIWKTMEMPELCFNILDGHWKIKRELRAVSRDELDKWMTLINQAIDFANEQGNGEPSSAPRASTKTTVRVQKQTNNGSNRSSSSSNGSRERKGRSKSTKHTENRRPEVAKKTEGAEDEYEDKDDDVYQWLLQIGLQRYTATFKAKGFASVDFIRETGIESDDLNFLGIKDANARKSLITAARILRGED